MSAEQTNASASAGDSVRNKRHWICRKCGEEFNRNPHERNVKCPNCQSTNLYDAGIVEVHQYN